MKTLKKISIIYFILICQLAYCQISIDSLIIDLKKPDFSQVQKAKESLELIGKNTIPELIKMLKDTSYIKLENTADLIYPRAESFYGHGNIIIYDINYISYRAGWVLEEITFKDFGYRIPIETFDDIINYGDSIKASSINTRRVQLAIKIEKWWKKNKNSWNRIDALKEALNSKNQSESFFALEYIDSNENYFPELTDEKFKKEIQPILTRLDIKSKKRN